LQLAAVKNLLQRVGTKRHLALLLLPVYLFLSLALFSSLHVHGRNGTCNFNGFEFQGSEPAQAYIPFIDCGFFTWREAVPASCVPHDGQPLRLADRAPPNILPAL
jgi:hypothetical protein